MYETKRVSPYNGWLLRFIGARVRVRAGVYIIYRVCQPCCRDKAVRYPPPHPVLWWATPTTEPCTLGLASASGEKLVFPSSDPSEPPHVVVVCCFLTLTLVKNLESVVTQRCWSPRKIRKTKWNQKSSGKYYSFPPKNARYGKRRTSEKVKCANLTHMAAGIHSTTA